MHERMNPMMVGKQQQQRNAFDDECESFRLPFLSMSLCLVVTHIITSRIQIHINEKPQQQQRQ